MKKNQKTALATETFNKFRELYPVKDKMYVARMEWAKMTEEEQALALIELPKHIERWRKDGTETQYIPSPIKWLHEKRFTDEIVENKVMTLDTSQWYDPAKGICDHNGCIDHLIEHPEYIEAMIKENAPFRTPCAETAKRHLEIIGLYA